MVHSQDPAVTETQLAVVYVNTIFLLLGVHGWEYFQSFGVEYSIIRGSLSLNWPLIPYMLGRVFLLVTLLLLAIETSPLTGVFTCQPGTVWIAISGAIAIVTSSMNLMIRTWVIWQNYRFVHVLLLLLTVGQWTVLALGAGLEVPAAVHNNQEIDIANIKASKSNGACVIYIIHPAMSAGVFMYTVCYDLIVLVLSIVGLSKLPPESPLKERLCTHGLLYFAVASMVNVLPTVFVFVGPAVMVGITGNFAMTASTVMSSRAVRSLLRLRDSHPRNLENDPVLTTRPQLPC